MCGNAAPHRLGFASGKSRLTHRIEVFVEDAK